MKVGSVKVSAVQVCVQACVAEVGAVKVNPLKICAFEVSAVKRSIASLHTYNVRNAGETEPHKDDYELPH